MSATTWAEAVGSSNPEAHCYAPHATKGYTMNEERLLKRLSEKIQERSHGIA